MNNNKIEENPVLSVSELLEKQKLANNYLLDYFQKHNVEGDYTQALEWLNTQIDRTNEKHVMKKDVNLPVMKEIVSSNVTEYAKSLGKGFYDILLLSSNKKTITNIQNKYEDILNMIGFSANDFHYLSKKENIISTQEVEQNVTEHLKKVGFIEKDSVLDNTLLNNTEDESKLKIVYTMLWPNLFTEIKKSMSLIKEVETFIQGNKFLSIIDKFAKRNNLSSEEVTHVLKTDLSSFNELFKNKKGLKQIQDNYENILESVDKFSALTLNLNTYTLVLIKAAEDMKTTVSELNVNPKRKEELSKAIDDSTVLEDKKQSYTYSTIKNNFITLQKQMKSSQAPRM